MNLITWQAETHLWFIFMGLASFVIAALAAIVYLFQSAQLKSKHPGSLFLKLPSLDLLDRLHFASLIIGVILFSLGILTGLFSAKDPTALKLVLRDPKVMLSLAACLLYWVILGFRFFSMGRGQKIAVSTVLACMLLFALAAAMHGAPPTSFHGNR